MGVGLLALVAALVLGVLCLAVVVLLVVTRVATDRADRRRLTLRTPVWRLVMTMTTGEDDEVDESLAALRALGRDEVAVVEPDAFGLIPKLRGAGQERLRGLLRHWGSADRAEQLVGSWSAVRRCRGLYRLGMLADPATVPLVVSRLHDRDFAVRRVAVQALGSLGDPLAVPPMLDLAGREPVLRRDFLAAVDRIGAVCGPLLEEELGRSLPGHETDRDPDSAHTPEHGHDHDTRLRRAQLAAEGLGLVDAAQAAPTLARTCLETDDVPLRLACLDALGRLGVPAGVPAMRAALDSEVADVRRAGAVALGLLGGGGSLDVLTRTLDDPAVEVARAAAQALGRSGRRGEEALAASSAPVALETRALAALAVPR